MQCKSTKVELELFPDPEISMFFEKGMRDVWWAIVANLNLSHRRNLFHYDITLKFKTEIKYEIDFYYYFYFTFHLLRKSC